MDQQESIQGDYDEIDLMDYLKVMIKRKWLILIIFILSAIAAGIFSYLSPKIYKIDTSLEVGKVAEKIVEAPSQVVEKIKGDVYGGLIREKLKISEEEYPKIKAENPKDTNLIKIEIESAKPDLAKDILGKINNSILAEHQEKIKIKKELLEKDIERIKIKVASEEEEKKNLEAKVEALEKVLPYQETPGSQFALFDTKEKLENKKQEIENLYLKINSLEGSLEDIRPTKIIKSPTVSEEPIKPKPLLNIVIAAVLGLFVGIFLAFFKEWWEKAK